MPAPTLVRPGPPGPRFRPRVGATSPPAGAGPTVAAVYVSANGVDALSGNGVLTDTRPLPGDYLLVGLSDSQVATAPIHPPGWTPALPAAADTVQGTNAEMTWMYLPNPLQATTYQWTLAGGRRTAIGLLIRGADPIRFLDVSNTLETGDTLNHYSPPLTTLGPNRLLVAYPVLRGFPLSAWSLAGGWSWEAGQQQARAVGTDGSTNIEMAAQWRLAPNAGTYTDVFPCAVSEPAIVAMFAVRPAGASDPLVGPTPVLIHPGRGPGMTRSWRARRSTDVPTAGAGVTLAGTAPAAADLDGTVAVARAAAGTSPAAADLDGSLSVARTLTAKATAAAGLTGAVRVAKAVTGQAPAAAHAAGTLRAARPVAGTAAAASSAAGSLTVTGPSVVVLAGTAGAASNAAGAAAVSRPLTGSASAAAAFVGALTVGLPFTPAFVGVDGGTSAGTTDGRAAAVGNAGGQTGTTAVDGTPGAAGGLSGGTTATGYL